MYLPLSSQCQCASHSVKVKVKGSCIPRPAGPAQDQTLSASLAKVWSMHKQISEGAAGVHSAAVFHFIHHLRVYHIRACGCRQPSSAATPTAPMLRARQPLTGRTSSQRIRRWFTRQESALRPAVVTHHCLYRLYCSCTEKYQTW